MLRLQELIWKVIEQGLLKFIITTRTYTAIK